MQGQRHYKLGFNISQNENIERSLLTLNRTLSNENRYPKTIIELGTYLGGMSFLIKDIFPQSEVHTFDIKEQCDISKLQKITDVKCNICNIFDKDNTEKIVDLINQEGQTVIFCDNGDKPKEFNLFSGYLKPGDVILAHDYAPNEQYYKSYMVDKIWNWLEIQDSDIFDAIKINNLSPFLYQEFLNSAWCCYRKE